jgi:hypothetical protein
VTNKFSSTAFNITPIKIPDNALSAKQQCIIHNVKPDHYLFINSDLTRIIHIQPSDDIDCAKNPAYLYDLTEGISFGDIGGKKPIAKFNIKWEKGVSKFENIISPNLVFYLDFNLEK